MVFGMFLVCKDRSHSSISTCIIKIMEARMSYIQFQYYYFYGYERNTMKESVETIKGNRSIPLKEMTLKTAL